MFNPFNKPKKIEFHTHVNGLEKMCPIVPASEEKIPNWVRLAAQEHNRQAQDLQNMTGRVQNVNRCPGIRHLLQRGYVVRAWIDFLVKTNGDGESMTWNTPDANLESLIGFPPMVFHTKEAFSDYFERWPEDVNRTLLKLHFPWQFSLPKGYVFLMLPWSYGDDQRFEACSGILDPDHNCEINIQLYWRVLNGAELVKKGTPLAHLIPVPKDEVFETNIRVSTEEEKTFKKIRAISTRFVDIPNEVNNFLRRKT